MLHVIHRCWIAKHALLLEHRASENEFEVRNDCPTIAHGGSGTVLRSNLQSNDLTSHSHFFIVLMIDF